MALRLNLGLGEAAKRDIGNDTGQLPDMSFFSSGGNANARYTKLPDGTIIQRGVVYVTANGVEVTLPTAFSSANYVIVAMDTDGNAKSGGCIAGTVLTNSKFNLHGLNWLSGTANDSTTGTTYWMAISL
ncbi:MAG: phage tail protein [Pantoea agglomerans]